MAETRICFVGGGSYNWMPKLLGDLALTPDLDGSVVLHDINPTALDDIQRYGRKVFDATGVALLDRDHDRPGARRWTAPSSWW